jgi:RNA 2',3'-cyclic 3'-phosphodiesterase
MLWAPERKSKSTLQMCSVLFGTYFMSTLRLFIAVPSPPEVRDAIALAQRELQNANLSGAKWVQPENVHLTLKFLGDVDTARVPDLKHALHGACEGISSFDLQLGAPGCFPNVRRPRVLWLGVEGDLTALKNLQTRIAQAAAPFQSQRDDKPFAPHLTLARFKETPRDALSAMEQFHASAVEWRADTIELISSTLAPHGPRYQTIALYELENKSK